MPRKRMMTGLVLAAAALGGFLLTDVVAQEEEEEELPYCDCVIFLGSEVIPGLYNAEENVCYVEECQVDEDGGSLSD